MLPLVHFLVLVVLPLATGYAMRRFWSSPDTGRMIAATAVGGTAGLVGMTQLHMCAEGIPLAQWIIPGACASGAMMFVTVRPVRRALALASILAAIVLSTTFTSAVHGDVYTGNPRAVAGRSAAIVEWHSFLTGLYRRAT